MSSQRPFMIDGVAIPTPTTYKFGVEELSSDATGRTLDGVMHKDVIAVKDYYECTWKSLSWADAATLLRAVDGKKEVSFTYADPRTAGTWLTNRFYIGKRTASAGNLLDPKNTWREISMTFTRI